MKSSKEIKAMLNIRMYIVQFLVQIQFLGKLRLPQTNFNELAEIWRHLWPLLKNNSLDRSFDYRRINPTEWTWPWKVVLVSSVHVHSCPNAICAHAQLSKFHLCTWTCAVVLFEKCKLDVHRWYLENYARAQMVHGQLRTLNFKRAQLVLG